MKKRLAIIFLLVFNFVFSKEKLGIGLIYDNPGYIELLNNIVNEELKKNLEDTEYEGYIAETVVINTENELNSALEQMQANSEIKAIMTLGVLPSELTLQSEYGYSKLVVAPFGLGEINRKIRNLSYISEPIDIVGDLEFIGELREVKNVTFLSPAVYKKGYISKKVDAMLDNVRKAGYEVILIGTDDNRKSVEEKLENTDVLYTFEADDKHIGGIIDLANEYDVITFARASSDFKDKNILLGYDNSSEATRRIRASVINILRRLEGDNPDEIVTNLGVTEKPIMYNNRVGKMIGIYPNAIFAQRVEIIGLERGTGEQLNYLDGMRKAILKNRSLNAFREDVLTSEYNVKIAKSAKKPSISAYAQYSMIDEDTASSIITPAERTLDGGISLNYLIYDDSINSSVDQSEYLVKINEALYKQELLDTVQNYATNYLTILELRSNLVTQKYNYQLVKDYLQIAKTMYEVGAAGPEDIYRLQSELSNALTNIAEVEGQVKITESKLNAVLDMPMGTSYSLESIEVENNNFGGIAEILRNSNSDVNGLRDFLIDEGIKSSPELLQIESQVKSKERELLAAKRERYMPTLALTGQWEDTIDDWGTGSEVTNNTDSWNIGARVEVPLYKGGSIGHTKKRVESELRSLDDKKIEVENQIGSAITSSLSEVIKDFISTATTKESAIAAKKNLALVEDFYAKGTTSISDLLDARTNSISADQQEIAARYSYLKSLVGLERSIGSYLMIMNEAERMDRLTKLEKFIGADEGRN